MGLATDGTTMWIGCYTSNTVVKFDVASHTITDSITSFTDGPTSVELVNGAVWVGNSQHFSEMQFIDENTDAVTSSSGLDVATLGGQEIAFDGSAVWVISGNASLLKLDANTATVLDTVSVGSNLRSVIFDGTSIWAASMGDGTISKVDPSTDQVLATISIGDGSGPSALAFDDTGDIWVSDAFDSTVVHVDAVNNVVLASLPLGGFSMAITAGAGFVWVATIEPGVVHKIDPATNQQVAAISVGYDIYGMLFDGADVWVSDRTGSVSIIKP